MKVSSQHRVFFVLRSALLLGAGENVEDIGAVAFQYATDQNFDGALADAVLQSTHPVAALWQIIIEQTLD